MRVLCIEDEEITAELVVASLATRGFTVDHVTNVEDAKAAMAGTDYDALILDLNLPGSEGGSDLLKSLRASRNNVPVLILSGQGATPALRIKELDAGADDYLHKPFDMGELVARMNALIRRPRTMHGPFLSCGNVVLSPADSFLEVGGQPLDLPRRELGILTHLMRNIGRPVPKDTIVEKLYSFDEEISSNSIEVQMHHLRKRLSNAGATVKIETQRGIGYVLKSL